VSSQPRRAARDRDGPATRARVIEAAIDTILEEGFYRASSNRIADRAGVSWGVIQHHFGTREALMMAAFEAGMRELLTTLEAATIDGHTFEERLDSFVDVIWGFYRQPKFVAYEELTLNLTHDPNMDADTVAMVTDHNARIGRRLAALANAVLDEEAVEVLPPGALVVLVRGVAVALTLTEAVPRRPRSPISGSDAARRVLVEALTALVRADRR
jgi:AcrR family transcriptional regulator